MQGVHLDILRQQEEHTSQCRAAIVTEVNAEEPLQHHQSWRPSRSRPTAETPKVGRASPTHLPIGVLRPASAPTLCNSGRSLQRRGFTRFQQTVRLQRSIQLRSGPTSRIRRATRSRLAYEVAETPGGAGGAEEALLP